ncbi:MAG: hypothetical protein IKA84_04705, partial [Clostridia bacterium]|nr:hypothetical protein [Clostridia bacterium]
TRCDYTEGKEVVVVEHEFDEENLFYHPSAPTCTEGAYIAGYCVYCENAYLLSQVPALGHTWEGGDCTTPATCSVCGATGDLVHTEGEDGTCACGYVFVETAEELIAALEAGKKVLLMNDIVMDATLKCPYGNSVGVAQKGGELNGNGYTLTVNGDGNYYAIITYGGTIANLTINAGFRAVVLYTPTEDVILDNVTIAGEGICYGFNTAEHPTLEGIDIVVKNSTIMGWVSFAGPYASVTFENCDFVQGVYYDNVIGRLVKPYVSTTFTNCTFVTNAYLDLSALEAGATVVLTGCKVGEVDVTVDVFTTTEDDPEVPFTYEAPAGVELVLAAVEGGVSFHRHGYVADVTAPTCTAAGKTVYTCACGDTYEEAGEAATGHAYADGICGNCGATDPNHYFVVSIADALEKSEGAKVQLSGTVTEIYQAYNSQYNNISVWITDENGDRILVFRVTGNYGIGDKLTIKGQITMYNEKPQIAQGATVVSSEKHVCSDFTEATCLNKAKCVVCGVETGELADHNYVDGKCICGAEEGGVEPTTVSKTMKDLITQYGWTSSTTKQSFSLDDVVSVKINGGSNTGKAYNGDHIRIYATDSPAGTITITVPEGYEIVSIKISTQTGTYAFLHYNNADICNKTISVSGNSVVLNSVKNGSDGKQVRVTGIEVTYKPVG